MTSQAHITDVRVVREATIKYALEDQKYRFISTTMIDTNSPQGTASRAAALDSMQSFVPRMGRHYTNWRNYDRGPNQHRDVSMLSPYIRRRLITEKEVIAAALQEHGPKNAEKFIQEVFWRCYFKGWLERRPQIWTAYVNGLNADLLDLAENPAMREKVQAAECGTTGLECFDGWSQELVNTGYLHNHARMWFASIWIFTFGLPWRLGADFFFRYLLDGDPASNTCSWRWVAGLHTRGKTYEAQAWNISKFTEDRFSPCTSDLQTDLQSLEYQEPHGLPDVMPLRSVTQPDWTVPTAIILTEDDCSLEDVDFATDNICAAAKLTTSHLRSPRDVSEAVATFEAAALCDAARRLKVKQNVETLRADVPTNVVNWVASTGARQVVMPYVPTGPLDDWMTETRFLLQQRGIEIAEHRRDWDALVWPHATAGFFKVKKKIPEILYKSGLL
ncbi:MAG: FAD-binding domain-containing protein [Pseudomonadota bacterium]